mmetsp:Transcript_19716/g.61232  ORF Transcript_19716/g.61232 Transcript_19716/m.61232 type:complete len:174 (-) Transcript_19716:160-681(-)
MTTAPDIRCGNTAFRFLASLSRIPPTPYLPDQPATSFSCSSEVAQVRWSTQLGSKKDNRALGTTSFRACAQTTTATDMDAPASSNSARVHSATLGTASVSFRAKCAAKPTPEIFDLEFASCCRARRFHASARGKTACLEMKLCVSWFATQSKNTSSDREDCATLHQLRELHVV